MKQNQKKLLHSEWVFAVGGPAWVIGQQEVRVSRRCRIHWKQPQKNWLQMRAN